MNILVVDDEAVMIDSIRIGLESSGHRVFMAHSAREAMDLLYFKGRRIDLVITDYLMPKMDGIDLLKAIRRRYPDLPVLIMTAFANKEMSVDAIKNRCQGFIEKPFNLDLLIDEIERITPRPKT